MYSANSAALMAYVISFYVLAQQWIRHVQLFDRDIVADTRILWLNLVLLMFIAFMPFVGTDRRPGGRTAVILYLAILSGAMVTEVVMSAARTRNAPTTIDRDPSMIRYRWMIRIVALAILALALVLAATLPTPETGLYALLLFTIIDPICRRISPPPAARCSRRPPEGRPTTSLLRSHHGQAQAEEAKALGSPATPAVDRDALLAELASTREGLSAERMGPEWGVMQRTLAKAGAGLDVRRSRHRDPRPRPPRPDHRTSTIPPSTSPRPSPNPSPAWTSRRRSCAAMRAYRKRVRVTKLDQESQLARSPLSSGKDADIDAIVPPNQFPPEVWRTLAHRGELEATGDGFYRIPIQRRDF